MCDFISVAFPKRLLKEFLSLAPRKMVDQLNENPTIAKALPQDWMQIFLVRSSCSCGMFYSEDELHSDIPTRKNRELLRRKYEKRNWSPARIERALASSFANSQNTDVPQNDRQAGFEPKVRELIAKFAKKHHPISILVHFYSGSLVSEKFTIEKRLTLPASEFTSTDRASQRDVLYTIVPDGN